MAIRIRSEHRDEETIIGPFIAAIGDGRNGEHPEFSFGRKRPDRFLFGFFLFRLLSLSFRTLYGKIRIVFESVLSLLRILFGIRSVLSQGGFWGKPRSTHQNHHESNDLVQTSGKLSVHGSWFSDEWS